jgi:hypothetical protein
LDDPTQKSPHLLKIAQLNFCWLIIIILFGISHSQVSFKFSKHHFLGGWLMKGKVKD